MVVVGWAVEDSSWHLGVMVTPELAQTRGGRWCGLARWINAEGDNAREAGEALASVLHKPFRLVPPTENEQPTVSAAPIVSDDTVMSAPVLPEPEPVPLMPLPINLGEWVLEQEDEDYVCEHSKAWRNRALFNVVFFIVLTIVFAGLSIGSYFSPFAPVQPWWLPLVGFVLTILLVLLVIRQIIMLVRATTLVIDNHERIVRVTRGHQAGKNKSGRTLLMSPFEGIEYVLVSHVQSRRESAAPYDRIWLEVWIHLYSPRRGFISVCYVSESQGRARTGLTFDARRPLDLHEVDTPAHHAASYLAEDMGIPAYIEGR